MFANGWLIICVCFGSVYDAAVSMIPRLADRDGDTEDHSLFVPSVATANGDDDDSKENRSSWKTLRSTSLIAWQQPAGGDMRRNLEQEFSEGDGSLVGWTFRI